MTAVKCPCCNVIFDASENEESGDAVYSCYDHKTDDGKPVIEQPCYSCSFGPFGSTTCEEYRKTCHDLTLLKVSEVFE